jgi:hypothetical protein
MLRAPAAPGARNIQGMLLLVPSVFFHFEISKMKKGAYLMTRSAEGLLRFNTENGGNYSAGFVSGINTIATASKNAAVQLARRLHTVLVSWAPSCSKAYFTAG